MEQEGGVVYRGHEHRESLCSKSDVVCSFLQGIKDTEDLIYLGLNFNYGQRSGKKWNSSGTIRFYKFLLPHRTAWTAQNRLSLKSQ